MNQALENNKTYSVRYFDLTKGYEDDALPREGTVSFPTINLNKSHVYTEYPLIEGSTVSDEIWKDWEPRLRELLSMGLEPGWRIDRSSWNPACVVYKRRNFNLLATSKLALAIYLIVAWMTSGLSLIVIFFLQRNYIELRGVVVRFVRDNEKLDVDSRRRASKTR